MKKPFHEIPREALLHARILSFGLIALSAVPGCDADQTADECAGFPQPATIGDLLFELYDCSPSNLCGKASLYRAGERVQVMEFDADGTVTGEARGVLVPTVTQSLDEGIAAIVEGGADLGGFDPQCLHTPGLPVALRLPASTEGVEFRHPRWCGPEGLVVIESQLHDVLVGLRRCDGEGLGVEVTYCHFDAKPNG